MHFGPAVLAIYSADTLHPYLLAAFQSRALLQDGWYLRNALDR
jgi:hypothetical protein